jgi:Domain of unknown function (DUF5666)
MMTLSRPVVFFLLILGVVSLGACGGGPSSSSDAQDVVLHGAIVGASGAGAHALSGTAGAGPIVVTVQGTPITTTVGDDGTFTFRGLPTGSFTLVFTQDGGTLGTATFEQVMPNQEITITIELTASGVVVLEERRTGIGHGDIEIEGQVEQVLVLDPAGDSRFVINGKTVVARPGQTAIREGNTARTVNDVTVGRQVHVKGTFMDPEPGVTPVLASEIKLQGPEASPSPGPSPSPGSTCFAPGANAEVEGKITAKGGSDITVNQQGKGDYQCFVSAGTRIRKGNTTYTFDQLATGWRVHVKGTGLGASGTLCQVQADEIMVQQN